MSSVMSPIDGPNGNVTRRRPCGSVTQTSAHRSGRGRYGTHVGGRVAAGVRVIGARRTSGGRRAPLVGVQETDKRPCHRTFGDLFFSWRRDEIGLRDGIDRCSRQLRRGSSDDAALRRLFVEAVMDRMQRILESEHCQRQREHQCDGPRAPPQGGHDDEGTREKEPRHSRWLWRASERRRSWWRG